MINLDDYNDYPMGDEKTYQNMKKYGSPVHPNSSAAKHSKKRKEMANKMKPGIHKIGENPSRFVHKGKTGDIDLYETWKGGKQNIKKTK